ncbi:hypothetical protein [Klebsiella quasipneumoniae]|uniref:hypothetical protein n=1 Tax=Klebsiella quasipneumoniae TaxID=1463165 RepID=UPI0021666F43
MKRCLLALACVALLTPSLSAQATWRSDQRQDALAFGAGDLAQRPAPGRPRYPPG